MRNKGAFCPVVTLYYRTNFRLFQIEKVRSDNFKFDENGRMFSKGAENTVGKEEIARYEHFSFSNNVFQGLVLLTCKNQVLFSRKGLTECGTSLRRRN